MLRMLRIESKKNVLKAVTPLIILLIIIAILSRNRYLTYVAILGAINAIAVLGLNLISGYTGQLHLGQAGFLGVGAYASSILILRMGMPYWLSFLCGIAISALFGALLGIPALRLRRGPYLALVTQTFNALVCTILLNWESLTGGPFGLSGIKKPHIGKWRIASLQSYLILTCVLLVLAYVAMQRIVASKYGQVFQAIRESEDAAQAVGINTYRYKTLAFSIAAAYGGIAGMLYGSFIGYLSPDQFAPQNSLALISMAIVGGLGRLEGGLLGAFLLTFLPELLRVTDQFRLIINGVLLLLTLAFLPDGLISIIEELPKKLAILQDAFSGKRSKSSDTIL